MYHIVEEPHLDGPQATRHGPGKANIFSARGGVQVIATLLLHNEPLAIEMQELADYVPPVTVAVEASHRLPFFIERKKIDALRSLHRMRMRVARVADISQSSPYRRKPPVISSVLKIGHGVSLGYMQVTRSHQESGSVLTSMIHPTVAHYEQQYLELMRRVWTEGDERIDRTGVGTRSMLGASMRFSLADDAVPLLTTKRVYWKVAAREMLWFLTGDTNIGELVRQGVHIWTDWPLDTYRRETGENIDREQFEARIIEDAAFADRWGDLGPVYGAQWVNWPRYEPAGDGLYRRSEKGHNQIAELVDNIRVNPGSRRLLFTGWNVAEVGQMALPPCHMTYQFQVAGGKLNGLLFQRSCDLGLGFAFNIFGLAMITRMLAQQCDLEAGEIVWHGGDVHLYLNHRELVEEQISRVPKGAPKLRIKRRPESIFDYRIEDFEVVDYSPQKHIAAPVAV